MNWIDLNEMRPSYGQEVYFKYKEDNDADAIYGTYEHKRTCMLGSRNGAMGEGFQDDYNKLPCDGDLWMDATSFIDENQIIRKE